MKATLYKIALIVLGIFLISSLTLNAYMGFVMLKLSNASFFNKLEIVQEYNIFENLSLGAYSMFLTSVLLVSMLILVVKNIVIKKS